MSVARAERQLISDLFEEQGPDEPTLCGDWTTRDLAAHLVLRETRFDAAPGIMIPAFAGYTERVQRGIAARPWPGLVAAVRSGPPWWSPLGIGFIDNAANTVEFFVHHEDVRRARPGWEPRAAEAERDKAVWQGVRSLGKGRMGRSPVAVTARDAATGDEVVWKPGADPVVISGAPGELLLFALGRDAVRLEFDGAEADIAALRSSARQF